MALAVIVILGAGVMIVIGTIRYNRIDDISILAAGLVSLAMGLVGASVVGAILATAKRDDSRANIDDVITVMRSVNDRLMISDVAKRITFRTRDLEMLREAIRNDLRNGNFDEALVLARDMAMIYGRKQESEEFRAQVMAARNAQREEHIGEAIREFDSLLMQREFEKARIEADKLQRLYPDSDRARGLGQRVTDALEQLKRNLEREFLEAYKRDEIDKAWQLLTELDKYLTEAEAAPLKETARGVIGKKKQNLGVQFKLAAHDKDWRRSVEVGEQIIREFPNSIMAEEVRQRLDTLRENAARQIAASQASGQFV